MAEGHRETVGLGGSIRDKTKKYKNMQGWGGQTAKLYETKKNWMDSDTCKWLLLWGYNKGGSKETERNNKIKLKKLHG